MKNKQTLTRARMAKVAEQKLQERSAVLYTRALERWNKRSLRSE
jgi:hypothetical protein